MRRSRLTEEQTVAILNQSENGISISDLTRKPGISEATFYRWKKKYSGMGVAELRRLKVLESENRKLKQFGGFTFNRSESRTQGPYSSPVQSELSAHS